LSSPVDYSGLLSCSIAGAASFEVITYEATVSPVVRPGMGHVADQVQVTITGQIQGADPADLSAKLADLAESVADGQNVIIDGLAGEPELQVLAARCLDGGPFLGVKIADGPVALVKSITLTVTGGQLPAGGQQGQNRYAVMTATRADGLRTVTWDGESLAPGGTSYFTGTVVAAFMQAYGPPKWSVRVDYKTSQEGVIGRTGYQLVATEQFGELPDNAGGQAVEGRITTRVERDEQMRKTSVFEFDLLLDRTADASATLASIRDGLVNGPEGSTSQRLILREAATIESLRENRLQASFTILESGWHDQLMNWSRTIRVTHDDQPAEEHRYLGADPILVVMPKRLGKLTDTGSATGAGAFVKPPAELFDGLPHEQPPQETYVDLNEAEKQTSWERAYFVPLASAGQASLLDQLDPNKLARPDASEFYDAAKVDEPPSPQGEA
jgi:hypothetical protein